MCPRLMSKARDRYVKMVMRGMDDHEAWLSVMGELKSIYNGEKK